MNELQALWELVRSIPRGKVASYGAIGQALPQPTSGFQVGRWMTRCPPDVPWWRVVSKHGQLPVWKRSAELEKTQADMLIEEGVTLTDGQIDMAVFSIQP